MPGVYTPPDYDLAGFIVGYVDEDAILGLASRARRATCSSGSRAAGLHTNGYLARAAHRQRTHEVTACTIRFLVTADTVADVLLAVHRSYLAGAAAGAVEGACDGAHHGRRDSGKPEPRAAAGRSTRWSIRRAGRSPTCFSSSSGRAASSADEMFRTFNMGVGMVVITADGACRHCNATPRPRRTCTPGGWATSGQGPVRSFSIRRAYRMKKHVRARRACSRLVCARGSARRRRAVRAERQRWRRSAGAQANVAQDACLQAYDSIQFMAPQLGLALAGGNATLGQGGTLGGLGHFSVGVRGNVFNGELPQVDQFHAAPRTRRRRRSALPTQEASARTSRPPTRRSASSRASAWPDERRRHRSARQRAYVPTIDVERRHDHAAATTGSSATARASGCSGIDRRAGRVRDVLQARPSDDRHHRHVGQVNFAHPGHVGQDDGVARRGEQELHRVRSRGRRRPGQVRPVDAVAERRASGLVKLAFRATATVAEHRRRSLTRTNAFVDAVVQPAAVQARVEGGQVSGGTGESRSTTRSARQPRRSIAACTARSGSVSPGKR